jgi:hypothetical protein
MTSLAASLWSPDRGLSLLVSEGDDDDVTIFMDDTTISEIIDVKTIYQAMSLVILKEICQKL